VAARLAGTTARARPGRARPGWPPASAPRPRRHRRPRPAAPARTRWPPPWPARRSRWRCAGSRWSRVPRPPRPRRRVPVRREAARQPAPHLPHL